MEKYIYMYVAVGSFIMGVLWTIKIYLWENERYRKSTEGKIVAVYDSVVKEQGRPGYVSTTVYVYEYVTDNGEICQGKIRRGNRDAYKKGDIIPVQYVGLCPKLLHTSNIRHDWELEKYISRICFIITFILGLKKPL